MSGPWIISTQRLACYCLWLLSAPNYELLSTLRHSITLAGLLFASVMWEEFLWRFLPLTNAQTHWEMLRVNKTDRLDTWRHKDRCHAVQRLTWQCTYIYITLWDVLSQWRRKTYYIFWVCVCSPSYPACRARAPYDVATFHTMGHKRKDIQVKNYGTIRTCILLSL